MQNHERRRWEEEGWEGRKAEGRERQLPVQSVHRNWQHGRKAVELSPTNYSPELQKEQTLFVVANQNMSAILTKFMEFLMANILLPSIIMFESQETLKHGSDEYLCCILRFQETFPARSSLCIAVYFLHSQIHTPEHLNDEDKHCVCTEPLQTYFFVLLIIS